MKILEENDIVVINDSVYKVTQILDKNSSRCRICDCDNVSGCQSYLRKFIKNKVAILGTEIINNYY